MANRRFSTYQALTLQLTRDGITNPGKLASFLLDTFLTCGGKIMADHVVGKGFCKEGNFKVWRDGLVKQQWLQYEYKPDAGGWMAHKPGLKLIKYINAELQQSKLLATQEGLERLDAKLSRMASYFIEKYDPPITEEKVAAARAQIESEEFPG